APAKDVAEHVAEDVAHVHATEARAGVAAAHAMLERGVAVLVVQAALAAVRQHFIGLLALLEPRLGVLVAGVAVRVVLHRAAAIGLLQLVLGRRAADAEDFVVVTLAHRSGPSCWRTRRTWSTCATGTERQRPSIPVAVAGGSVLLFVVLDLGELGIHHIVGL